MPVAFTNCVRVVAMSPKIVAACPYKDSNVPWIAVVFGGTIDNVPPVEWAQNLSTSMAISPEAQATVCVRWVDAFLWTAYYDPTGQVEPAPMLAP